MAVDIQVIFPQVVVPLSQVRTLQGVTPRSLDIIGTDFRYLDQVLINDVASPNVIVVSRTRLFAQVPTLLQRATLTSVTVISNSLSLNGKSLLRFQLGPSPKKVSGILRLVQLFLKILFTSAGSDIFAPVIGAGALKGIGATVGTKDGSNLVADFVVAVNTTQRQVIALQARDPSIPPDERLLSAQVLNASFNANEGALIVGVEITSQAGSAATANLTV